MYFPRFFIRLAIATGLLLGAAHSATAQPRYVVTLGNMTVWNGVAHRVDTDYIALSVHGPNGQNFSKGYGPNNLHKKQTTNWALSSTPIDVPADAKSTLTIAWAAANKGTSHTQEVIDRLNTIAQDIGENVPNVYAQIISYIAGHIVGYFTVNCDCALFGGKVTFSGAQLASGQLGAPWSSEGSGMWHAVFDYPNIQSSCDTGHYNLEVHIKKQ